jgi:AcrR family transcriptional regulator
VEKTLTGEVLTGALESDRRRHMVEVATDLFLEFGYDGATLDMLIERTKGSRRQIYDFFGNKEGLLRAIVTERCMCLAQDVEAISLEGLAPRDMLRKIGFVAAKVILSPEGVKLFRLVVQESVRNPQLGRLMYENGVALSQEKLADYFKRETQAGRLRIEHPVEAASMFFAAIKGDLHFIALFWGHEQLTDEFLRARVERGVEVFLRGVLPR